MRVASEDLTRNLCLPFYLGSFMDTYNWLVMRRNGFRAYMDRM